MKPFINKETSEKIKIFGTDQSEWKSALLCEIDSDQLPAYYGGTMTDPNGDPKCPSKVCRLLLYAAANWNKNSIFYFLNSVQYGRDRYFLKN